MEHPDQIMRLVTRFLDQVLDQYGIYLFVVLLWGLLGLLVWAISRRNRPDEARIHAILLPLGRVIPDNQRLDPPSPEPHCVDRDDM